MSVPRLQLVLGTMDGIVTRIAVTCSYAGFIYNHTSNLELM